MQRSWKPAERERNEPDEECDREDDERSTRRARRSAGWRGRGGTTTVRRGRARSSVTTARTGCSGSCAYGSASAGSDARIPRRQEEQVPAGLRPVAEGERDQVAEPARRTVRGRPRRTRRGTPRLRQLRHRARKRPQKSPWASLLPFDRAHKTTNPADPVVKPPPSAVASRKAGRARTRRKNPPQRPCLTGRSISRSTG